MRGIPQLESYIIMLKQALADTDYMLFKCLEAKETGDTMPYNLEELISIRKGWRVQIKELEKEMESK